jgi:hypothetical protein
MKLTIPDVLVRTITIKRTTFLLDNSAVLKSKTVKVLKMLKSKEKKPKMANSAESSENTKKV